MTGPGSRGEEIERELSRDGGKFELVRALSYSEAHAFGTQAFDFLVLLLDPLSGLTTCRAAELLEAKVAHSTILVNFEEETESACEFLEQGFADVIGIDAINRLRPAIMREYRHVRAEREIRQQLDARENELSQSLALFDVFMNHSPVTAFLKRADGTHTYANRPADENMRPWAEGFIGRSDFDSMPYEVAENIRRADRSVIESGETIQLTERLEIPNLGARYFQLLKFPVQVADSETLVGTVVLDVSERIAAEESLRSQVGRLQALNKIDRTLVGTSDLGHALSQVLEHTVRVVPSLAAAVYRLISAPNNEGKTLLRLAAIGSNSALESELPEIDRVGGPSYWIPIISKGAEQGYLRIEGPPPTELGEADGQFLEAVADVIAMAMESDRLLSELQAKNEALIDAYDATLDGWSRSLDARDRETEGHSRRVTEMGVDLARRLGYPDQDMVHFRRGALLHDIGKIGIPDAVLNKKGPLTEEEWTVMRTHPEIAMKILSEVGFLRPALEIPLYHHERFDGTGYPLGLKGTDIPWAARIFSVVDVFDALTSDRPYRKAWAHHEAFAYIASEAGRQFDPAAVAEFLRASGVPLTCI